MSDINKVAKGQRKERMCELELQAKGYLTWKTIRHRFLNIDLFGLFDVVGLAADGGHMLFIQVKTERVSNDIRGRVQALKMPRDCYREIWIYKNIRRSRNDKGKFQNECGQDCRRIIKERACPGCNQWFDLDWADPDQKYCSLECYRIIQREKQIEKTCPICSKKFMTSPSEDFLIHCSRICMGQSLSAKMMGEKHPLWMGGTNVAYERGLNSGEWNRLRRKILKRDNHLCQECKKPKKELHVHHVIPYRISANNELENLITLCEGCHMKKTYQDSIRIKSGEGIL